MTLRTPYLLFIGDAPDQLDQRIALAAQVQGLAALGEAEQAEDPQPLPDPAGTVPPTPPAALTMLGLGCIVVSVSGNWGYRYQ